MYLFYLQEERNVEQRISREADRIAVIRQQAVHIQQQKEQKEEELLYLKEQEALQLQQRRENERKAREDMAMTVDLDQQNDYDDSDLKD